jgi:hypothetical protein
MDSPRGKPNNRRGQFRGNSNGRRGGHNSPTQGRPSPSVGRAPHNICNFYWSTGSCNRGFDCNFRHQTNPVVATASEAAPTNQSTPDFFSAEGLALNNNSVRNTKYNLKPSEAHNHLKSFIGDMYTFRNSSAVEGFVKIFASINERNKSWVRSLDFAYYASVADFGVHGL